MEPAAEIGGSSGMDPPPTPEKGEEAKQRRSRLPVSGETTHSRGRSVIRKLTFVTRTTSTTSCAEIAKMNHFCVWWNGTILRKRLAGWLFDLIAQVLLTLQHLLV